MHTQSVRVLVVEDVSSQRILLGIALRKRGFEVVEASSAAEARREARQCLQRPFEVAVLDMRLKDGDSTAPTGAALGMELKRELRNPPEFLIFSAYPRENYYAEAFELDASGFLVKGVFGVNDVATHVTALAIKRRLGQLHEDLRTKHCLNLTEQRIQNPVVRFCNDLLLPMLQSMISFSLILMVQEVRQGVAQTWKCSSASDATAATPDLETLLRTLNVVSDYSEPRTLSDVDIQSLGITASELTQHHVCLGPLAEHSTMDVDASVVLAVVAPRGSHHVTEQATILCKAVLRYCRKPMQQILGLATHLLTLESELEEARERQRLIVANTAEIFLKVGQEVLYQIQEYHRSTGLARAAQLESLEELASDLRDGGELLEDLGRIHAPMFKGRVDLPDVLRDLWTEVGPRAALGAELRMEGGASLTGDREGVQLALAEILEWLLRQGRDHGSAVRLTARFSQTLTHAVIDILCAGPSDKPALRRPVFSAGGLPEEHLRPGPQLGLSLARVILDLRSGGSLEDHSEEHSEFAYHFRVRLPRMPSAEAMVQ